MQKDEYASDGGVNATQREQSNCRTKLIDDFPTDNDAFDTHEKIARIIAELINHEEGGKAVALQGAWGAGKSSIIKMLERELPNRVFVFDAWSHEKDPLRRAFLEELLEFLETKFLENKTPKDWKGDDWRDEITKRVKKTTTTVFPKLPTWGKIVAASSFLVPLGLVVTAHFLGGTPDQSQNWLGLILGLLLTVAPLLTVGLAALLGKCINVEFAFLPKDATQANTTLTVETPDPTSIEFAKLFNAILGDASPTPDKRLLMVVDNLDRVSPQRATELWATLRVFFEACALRRLKCWKCIWLLIPYDRTGAERLWVNDSQEGEDGTILLKAFLNKTFQVVFRVPSPVVSDQEAFLLKMLRDSMPEHDCGDFDVVWRLFHRYQAVRGTPPSPRDMKTFVNGIGALHLQWEDSIPLAHLAYYTLVKQKFTTGGIVAALRKGQLPEEQLLELLPKGLSETLPQILYGATREKAVEILLATPIEAALVTGDDVELKQLSASPAFLTVFEDVIREKGEEWVGEPSVFAKVAEVICTSGLQGLTTDGSSASEVKRLLRRARTIKWSGLDTAMAEGISQIIQFINDEVFTDKVFGDAVGSIGEREKEANTDELQEWTDGLVKLLETIDKLDHSTVYKKGITLDCPAKDLLTICGFLGNERSVMLKYASYIGATASPVEIAGLIKPKSLSKPWEGNTNEAIKVLIKSKIEVPWSTFTSDCQRILEDTSSPSVPDTVLKLLHRLWKLHYKGEPAAKAPLSMMVQGGQLEHHLASVDFEKDAKTVAKIIATIIFFRNPSTAPPAVGDSSAGHGKMMQFLNEPQAHSGLRAAFCREVSGTFGGKIVSQLIQYGAPCSKILACCLQELANSEKLPDVLEPEILVENWERIESAITESGKDSSSFFKKPILPVFVKDGRLLDYIVSQQFELSQSQLYMRIAKAGGIEQREFRNWCEKGLGELLEDDWTQEFTQEGYGLQFASYLKGQDASFFLEQDYSDALRKFIRGDAEGMTAFEQALNEQMPFLELLSPEDLGVLRDKVFDEIGVLLDRPEEFFSIFGRFLAADDKCLKRPQTLTLLVQPAVENLRLPVIRWLLEAFAHSPQVEKAYKKSHIKDTRPRIRKAIESADDPESIELLKRLGVHFGLKYNAEETGEAEGQTNGTATEG